MNKKTVYDKSIKQPLRQNNEVNLSTFGYLISEYIQYTMNKKRNIEQELQKFGESIVGMIKGILNSAGYPTENVDYVDYEIEDDGTSSYPKTQFYIKFDPQVILREKN
ncbi:hypothetical protein PPERSA_06558 [Pseudocohnilembus persalinus]|uniref:Uncharacterized protein n=1 Tax=Pseudocohnilembus persalinus TaxID=266149 RepID=A0A0V0QRT8_PSEPJ|nr:hypothetical protein PPERSA_06558 [Pseudocohnilembus persalinus]|eukprot:KRX04924.1 hypothetical protein PPERSA_06558 [Pseudocohnilembus persalinus]